MTYFKILARFSEVDLRRLQFVIVWELLLMPNGVRYVCTDSWPLEAKDSIPLLPPFKKIRYWVQYQRSPKGQYRYKWAWANILTEDK